MVKLVVGLLMCAISAAGLAQAPRPGAAWYAVAQVLLGFTEPGVGLSGSWQFDQADNGDKRIIKNEQRLGTQVSGSVLAICDDRALLLKDLQPTKGIPATSELYGPVRLLQLVLRLLDRGLPQGPQAITGETAIAARDDVNPIKVTLPDSSAEFLAPWQVRGKVARIASDQIKFDLTYSYTTAAARGRQLEMTLVGAWSEHSNVPAFGNDMSLAGWTVYRIDPAMRVAAGVSVVERRVVPQAARFNTLGDLRAHIERGWQANPRARRQMECKL